MEESGLIIADRVSCFLTQCPIYNYNRLTVNTLTKDK